MRYNADRARIAITLIWIILGLEIMMFISGFLQYNLLQNINAGIEISDEAANFNDLREGAIGILYLVVLIISAVTFIRWFRRAYFNLHTQVNYLEHDEGWAAGAWFVPILNLFRPYNIMRELYNETDELLKKKVEGYTTMLRGTAVGWWWFFWIIAGFLGNASFRLAMHAESVEELINVTVINMASNIVGIPSALLAVKVIKDYSKMEDILYQLRDGDDALLTHIQGDDILDATL